MLSMRTIFELMFCEAVSRLSRSEHFDLTAATGSFDKNSKDWQRQEGYFHAEGLSLTLSLTSVTGFLCA